MKKHTIFLLVLFIIWGCRHNSAKDDIKTVKKPEAINPTKVRFAKMEEEALKEPYRGIFTEGGKIDNLFKIHATGISTLPIKKAAESFLNSLSSKQKEVTTFNIDDEEWRKWCNVDNGIYDRQGVSLKELTNKQKEEAFQLIQASLSAKGLQLSKDIMKTDQTLKAIMDLQEESLF